MASHFLQAKNGFSFSLGKKFSRWRSILRPLGHGGHTSFVVSRGLVAFRFFSLAASPVWPVLWILQRMCPQTARRKKKCRLCTKPSSTKQAQNGFLRPLGSSAKKSQSRLIFHQKKRASPLTGLEPATTQPLVECITHQATAASQKSSDGMHWREIPSNT